MTAPTGVQGFVDTRMTALSFVDFTVRGDWQSAQALLHQHDDPDFLREVIVSLTRIAATELTAHHPDAQARIDGMRRRLAFIALHVHPDFEPPDMQP